MDDPVEVKLQMDEEKEFVGYAEFVYSHVWEENKLVDQKIAVLLAICSVSLAIILGDTENLPTSSLFPAVFIFVSVVILLFSLLPKRLDEVAIRFSELKETKAVEEIMPEYLLQKCKMLSEQDVKQQKTFGKGIRDPLEKSTTRILVGEKLFLRATCGFRVLLLKEKLFKCAYVLFLLGITILFVLEMMWIGIITSIILVIFSILLLWKSPRSQIYKWILN